MRRTIGALTSGLLVVLVATVALASTANYKDSFSSATYTGSNGSLVWPGSTPWKDVGEPNNPSSGKVQALTDGNCPDGSCLAIRAEALNLSSVGAMRAADLSVFSSATLKFQMNVVLEGIINLTDASLLVEAWDGSSWDQLDSFPLSENEGLSSPSLSLGGSYLNDNFILRFVVAGLLDGDVYLDHIEIVGTVPSTTTTSSTTTTTSTTSSTTTSSSTTTTTLPISTTLPTVTTTLPPLLTTTTTSSTTTTTTEGTTTTMEGAETSTTTTSSSSGGEDEQDGTGGGTDPTTTTSPNETSTTEDNEAVTPPPEPPDDPGLREASVGLQVGYQDGRLGEITATAPDILGVDIEPNYTMAVEVIESSWAYLLVLVLVIAAAIVSGLDRRRLRRAKHTAVW